jgi:hypothetical protein
MLLGNPFGLPFLMCDASVSTSDWATALPFLLPEPGGPSG